jgi:tetratricopeptide (TPR) repeat protein
VTFLLSLTAFGVISTVFWRQTEHQRQRAEKASQFLEDLIKSVDPDETKGKELTAIELFEHGRHRIAEDLAGEPELQIDIAGTLGEVFYKLGDYDKSRELMEQALTVAEPLLRKSLRNRRSRHGAEHTRVAAVLDLLGQVLAAQGRDEEAILLYDEALTIRRRRFGEDHPDVAQTKKNLAELLIAGDPATAQVLLTQALASFERSRAPTWKIADAESVLGAYLVEVGHYEEAEPCLNESYETLRNHRGERSVYAQDAQARALELYKAWASDSQSGSISITSSSSPPVR